MKVAGPSNNCCSSSLSVGWIPTIVTHDLLRESESIRHSVDVHRLNSSHGVRQSGPVHRTAGNALVKPQRRTTRAISAPSILSASPRVCPKSRGSLIVRSGDFRAEFDEGGGLENRRLGQCKMWTRQVLISRTLSACGEVAEWPKAAVC